MLEGCYDVVGFIVLVGVAVLISVVAAVRHAFAGGPVLVVSAELVDAPSSHLRLVLSTTNPRSVEVERISVPRSVVEALGLTSPVGFGVFPSGERPHEIVFGGSYFIPKGQVAAIDFPAERATPVEGGVSIEYAYRVGFSSVTARATARLLGQGVG